VDEWKKQLDDLHKALAAAFTIEPQSYTITDPGNGGGGSRGGGGGGGGTTPPRESDKYFEIYDDKGFRTNYVVKAQNKDDAKKKVKEKLGNNYFASESGLSSKPKWATKVFKQGGIADFTGPAWLDGSPMNPERVLSPYQTELFETMVQALEKISTVNVPSMPNFGGMHTGNSNTVSVGDIIVNVDNLDTDDDYEELADRVSSVLMDRIGKTAVIGGLRINPT